MSVSIECMQKIRTINFVAVTLLVCSLISILLIDRPLSLILHNYGSDQLVALRFFTEVIPYAIFATVILAVINKLWKSDDIVNSSLAIVLSVSYFIITIFIAMELKTCLKIIFGRYWPTTWVNNNLSLIHDGVYGFDWWHGFDNLGSFPSGHATLITFCLVWVIRIYPAFMRALLLMGSSVIICLILLNYHYLGDCLAGVGLGLLCGNFSVILLLRLVRIIIKKSP